MTRSLERGVVGLECGTDGLAGETSVAIDDRRQRGAVVAPDRFTELDRHVDLLLVGPSFEKDGMSAPNPIFGWRLGRLREAEPIALREYRGVPDRVIEKHFRRWIGRDARVRDGNDLYLEPVCLP
jgi:hypothetical protein